METELSRTKNKTKPYHLCIVFDAAPDASVYAIIAKLYLSAGQTERGVRSCSRAIVHRCACQVPAVAKQPCHRWWSSEPSSPPALTWTFLGSASLRLPACVSFETITAGLLAQLWFAFIRGARVPFRVRNLRLSKRTKAWRRSRHDKILRSKLMRTRQL
jgi:hypothetical protein